MKFSKDTVWSQTQIFYKTTVEYKAWMSNCISNEMIYVITYLYHNHHVIKRTFDY